jgi:hypothetical protein
MNFSHLNSPKLRNASDEISALVLDPGYSSVRAGFAGEDVPKSVAPSYYGTTASNPYIFGDNGMHTPLPDIEIKNPMAKDGTVEDWDAAAKLWQYAITSRLTNPKPRNPMSNGLNKDSKDEDVQAMEIDEMDGQESLLGENPLLMSETGWNAGKGREKGIEIAMEEWGCPAFWLARNGVLASLDTLFVFSSHTISLTFYQIRSRQAFCHCSRPRRLHCIRNTYSRWNDTPQRRDSLSPSWKLHI